MIVELKVVGNVHLLKRIKPYRTEKRTQAWR
jgi:hypothetical protein